MLLAGEISVIGFPKCLPREQSETETRLSLGKISDAAKQEPSYSWCMPSLLETVLNRAERRKELIRIKTYYVPDIPLIILHIFSHSNPTR